MAESFLLAFPHGGAHDEEMIRLLFVGDIVGRPGREIIMERMGRLRSELGIDAVIANAENVAHGAGITEGIAKSLLSSGIDAITLGDHVWDQRGWEEDIGGLHLVCRPANLPKSCPGREFLVINVKGVRVGIFTVLGRQYLGLKGDCPFLTADAMLTKLSEETDACFVEIHAEATSEKQALGWYLDGRAMAVVGTHTHVPTADACVLPKGTGFICDVGMTGPYASVLGREVEPVIGKFLDGMPRRFPVAENDVRISAVLVEYDESSKKTVRMELVTVRRNNVDLATSRL